MSFFYWLYIISCKVKSLFRNKPEEYLRVNNARSVSRGDRVGIRAEVDNAMNGMFGAFIQHCDEILGESKNFYTLLIHSSANGILEVTIQRPDKVSPTERIIELENQLRVEQVKNALLESKLEEALQVKPKQKLVRNKSKVS